MANTRYKHTSPRVRITKVDECHKIIIIISIIFLKKVVLIFSRTYLKSKQIIHVLEQPGNE